MVAVKRPHGRRLLLPTEVELCKLLNLSEDEYWYFVDTTAAYNGQRPEGYELIPDIRNGAIATWAATEAGKAILIQIGIAVAAATVSYLLTPKPKELKQGGSRRTADAIGNTRFAPQASFNSIQELASIGDVIPLVFTRALQVVSEDASDSGETYGGVRVNGQLLWSQLVSLGKYQRLKALILFSHGTIGKEPNFEGFAVGDTLLSEYNRHKLGLYFKNGSQSIDNRIKEKDRDEKSKLVYEGIGNDPFVVNIPNLSGDKGYSHAFSGTRNPTTQAVFGVYFPIPNCQTVRLPYELVRDQKGATKESIRDLMRKRKKVEFAHWPVRAGLISLISPEGEKLDKGHWKVPTGYSVVYQVVGGGNHGVQKQAEGHGHDYEPHGVDDVDSLTVSIREQIDDSIAIGEQYMFGTALTVCTHISPPKTPWNLTREDDYAHRAYTFKVIESGTLSIGAVGENLALHCDNPRWYDPGTSDRSLHKKGEFSLSDFGAVFYRQEISGSSFVYNGTNIEPYEYPVGTNDLYHGYDIYAGYKVALATITNNRKCDATEIGIKSNVYKRIQFANVKSQPSEEALKKTFDAGTQIQLGQMNVYAKRFSFFMLQAKGIGHSVWVDLKNTETEDHTGLFVIEGTVPEPVYNSITILHPTREQYEFRFKPYPGNHVYINNLFDKSFNLLRTSSSERLEDVEFKDYAVKLNDSGSFFIRFQGDSQFKISKEDASNPEWNTGESQNVLVNKVIAATHTASGESLWWEDKGYSGGVVIQPTEQYSYGPPEIDKDGSDYIVLWNKQNPPPEETHPDFFKGNPDNYVWEFFYNQEAAAAKWKGSITSKGFANNNGAWNTVKFETPRTGGGEWHYSKGKPNLYKCANPGGENPAYHVPDKKYPEGNDHKFWVTREVWGRNKVTYSEGEYKDLHGTSASNLIEELVYKSDDTTLGLKVKYRVKGLLKNPGQAPQQWIHWVSWQIDTESAANVTGHESTDSCYFYWTDGTDSRRKMKIKLVIRPKERPAILEENFSPFDAIADWNVHGGDENSNRNDPEHEIVFVNEILSPTENAQREEEPAKYGDLAFAGLRINSSKEWTNFSQFSAYFTQGIEVEKLDLNGKKGEKGASNLFPEIAYALLTDSKLGAGKLVGVDSVDDKLMGLSAIFCSNNRFFWDGVISSKLNLRDFIFEHAGYCLLDFTIIGGRFSLRPSVPYNSSGLIDRTVKPEIKCLFTDGNIKDLQVSFLSPEERQTFQAVVLYRDEEVDGFPETKSLLIREDGIHGSESDPIETFDMSGFCTSRTQAVAFASFAIKTRRLVDHGLTFKTAPQYVQGLAPGDYFRLVSEVTHTSRFRNGATTNNGLIVSNSDGEISNSLDAYYWVPGTEGVRTAKVGDLPRGVLFTIKNETTENKVYKCETISYGEDGLLEVSGSFAPTEPPKLKDGTVNPAAGRLSVMQGWNLYNDTETPSHFVIVENQ